MVLLSPRHISRLACIAELSLSFRGVHLYGFKVKPHAINRFSNTRLSSANLIRLSSCRLSHSITVTEPVSDIAAEINKEAIFAEKTKKIIDDIEERMKPVRQNDTSLLIGSLNENIVTFLLRSKIPESQITRVLCKTPSLSRHPPEAWRETVVFLKSNLFQPNQLLFVLGACPGLIAPMGAERKLLLDALAWLRSCGIGEGRMQAVVAKNPVIATRPVIELKRMHAFLLEVFTRAELTALLMSCPSVLTTPWEETSAKLEYLYERMGVTSKDIVKSLVLTRPLERIVVRHEFLVRQGLYARPNKRGVRAVINAPLRNIVDSDDKAFAVIVARATEGEFSEFVEASRVKKEEELETDSDSESDDESSSDSESSEEEHSDDET